MLEAQVEGQHTVHTQASTSTSASTSASATVPGLPPNHRQTRTILSCRTCRRRKLRCDRQYPRCGRCQRHRETCTYAQDQQQQQQQQRGYSERTIDSRCRSKSPKYSHGPSSRFWESNKKKSSQREQTQIAEDDDYDAVDEDEDADEGVQEAIIAASQSKLSHNHQPGQYRESVSVFSSASAAEKTKRSTAVGAGARVRTGIVRAAPKVDSASLEIVACRGRDFKTQFYGCTTAKSIITHFPNLCTFMEAAVQHTSLPRAQGELKALQVRWKTAKAKEYIMADAELLHLLPDRNTVDTLVRLYFETCETLFRILHAPSFWEEYQIFWENPPTAARPAFVVLILLTMASVSCVSLNEVPSYVGDSAVARERAIVWIDVSECWLRRQSKKRAYLAIWQIRCLLLLAKQTNAVKKKQLWTATGTLVREAMSAGFHLNFNQLNLRMSPFDLEMRRRLWATIVEFELQASTDRGMPSATANLSMTFDTVLNINDDELAVDCKTLPESKPLEEYTTCSYLHISSASFPLRVTLNTIGNDASSPISYEEVAGYEDAITQELEKLPRQADPRNAGHLQGMPPMVRTLLDIQLRQFLLLLHAPFARQAGLSLSLRSSPSMVVCMNIAATILEQHSKITASGNLLLLLLRNDYLSSALIMCQTMYNSISLQNNLFFNSTSNTCAQYAESALNLLEERITRLGTGHLQYWYVSATCALLRATISPPEAALQKQRAIDRVLRQVYRVLTSQIDLLEAKKIIIPIQLSKLLVCDLQTTYDKDGVPMGNFEPPFEQLDFDLEEFFFGGPPTWAL